MSGTQGPCQSDSHRNPTLGIEGIVEKTMPFISILLQLLKTRKKAIDCFYSQFNPLIIRSKAYLAGSYFLQEFDP